MSEKMCSAFKRFLRLAFTIASLANSHDYSVHALVKVSDCHNQQDIASVRRCHHLLARYKASTC